MTFLIRNQEFQLGLVISEISRLVLIHHKQTQFRLIQKN